MDVLIQILKVIGWIFAISFVTVALWCFYAIYDASRMVADELGWLFRSSDVK